MNSDNRDKLCYHFKMGEEFDILNNQDRYPERKINKPADYNVLVIGAGECFNRNLKGALDFLGPPTKRIIVDIDRQGLNEVKAALAIQADAVRLPLSLGYLQNTVAIVATPSHLPVIKELILSGVRKLIVEKPVVNNGNELTELEQILNDRPDIKLYPLDYYQQKSIPLDILTGKIKPSDSRFNLVVDEDNNPISENLAGSLHDHIGKITGIEIELVEGSELGVPDLDRRPWLENDPVAGGMLLDLGTHAFAPLFYSGLIRPENLVVVSAERKILGSDRESLIPRTGDKPEIFAEAILTAKDKDGDIKINFRVGKIPEEGRSSNIIIHGEKGDIIMGLKRKDFLRINPKVGQNLQIKLAEGTDLYGLALDDADQYFKGKIDPDDYYQAMRNSILLIDKIKALS